MRLLLSSIVLLSVSLPCVAQDKGWLGAWTTANVPMEADRSAKLQADTHLGDSPVTIRQTVHLSYAGKHFRVRFSIEFGTAPQHIGPVHVAFLAAASKITPGTDHALLFAGQPSVTIPAGGFVASDAVPAIVSNGAMPIYSDLVISMVIPAQSLPVITYHADAKSTAFFAAGDQTAAEEFAPPTVPPPNLTRPNMTAALSAPPGDRGVVAAATQPGAQRLPGGTSELLLTQRSSFFFLKDVEVDRGKKDVALVCFGDSITDGAGSTTETNRRWPDQLAGLFSVPKKTPPVSVLNAGIGGNKLLEDGYGPKASDRFERDVLSQPGVKFIVVMEGINDIGSHHGVGVTAEQIIAAQTDLARRAHERGLRIFGGTLTPFEGAGYYTPEGEAIRQQVNAFLRGNQIFDGVFDFDKALQDPKSPGHMLAKYDSGDHLHPSDEGYEAMAAAVPQKLLTKK